MHTPQPLRQRLCSLVRFATVAVAALLAFASTPSAEAARARPVIQNGNLVASDGTQLRGAPFFMSIFNTWHMRQNETTYRDYFRSISRDYGMNCVRVSPWIGNWEYDIRNNSNHQTEILYMLDKVVQWADEDNIYVMVNMHTAYGTVLTQAKVMDFWNIVAPRFKDRTHVIFELVNEPHVGSARSTMAGIYSAVRAIAPNTHLVLWSLNNPDADGFTAQDLRNASSINYSNASFGFHVYEYILGKNAKWEAAKAIRNAGFPVVCTEFYSLTNANDMPIDYNFLVDNIRFARSSTYNMSWVQWGPRFNYASMDQYGNNHLYNSDIGFFQVYKDRLNAVGINWWSGGGTPAPGNLNGTYELKCNWGAFALNNPATTAGTIVRMANPGTSNNQRWILQQVSGSTYRIKSAVGTNLYLQGSTTNWANATVATLNTGSLTQQWDVTLVSGTVYRIQSKAAGRFVLTGRNTSASPDNNVRVATLDPTWTSQQWFLNRK